MARRLAERLLPPFDIKSSRPVVTSRSISTASRWPATFRGGSRTLGINHTFARRTPDDHLVFQNQSPTRQRGSFKRPQESHSPTVPQTQVIISFSPNTSLTRQRRFDFTDPDDHQPTQVIISFSRTGARRASEGHSNARKSPTNPQSHKPR